jgi:hypothetical protein
MTIEIKIHASACTLIILCSFGFYHANQIKGNPKHKNVLFIIADDLNPTLGTFGITENTRSFQSANGDRMTMPEPFRKTDPFIASIGKSDPLGFKIWKRFKKDERNTGTRQLAQNIIMEIIHKL